MSSSTISTVNKYLLSSSGPYVPPAPTLKQSGMIFPNAFTGLSTILGNIFTPNARHVFSSNMSGTAWRDVANGYELDCSSYYAGTPAGVLTYWSVNEAFSGIISSGSQSFWFPCQHVQPLNYFRDGVDQGKYTQTSYNTSGIYIGGGTGYFWTTIYDTGSVNGEWIQLKTPFQMLLTHLHIAPRFGSAARSCKNVRVLGSDDGITWSFIGDVIFGTFTDGSYQIKPVTTSLKFYYIRLVFRDVATSNINLNIGDVRFTFDAYA
jgi:hypothetical protein